MIFAVQIFRGLNLGEANVEPLQNALDAIMTIPQGSSVLHLDSELREVGGAVLVGALVLIPKP